MKNNYIVDGKKVMDLIEQPSSKGKWIIKCFLLEDGSIVQRVGTRIQVQCSVCGNWKEYTWGERYEDKPYTCSHCRAIGENNPMYGKKHSDEFKQRLSAQRKGVWCVGKNNPMFGKPCYYNMTDEEKQRWKDNIGKSVHGENNPMFGKNIKDFMTDEKYELWKQHLHEAHNNMSDEQKKQISYKLSLSQKRLQESDPKAYFEMKARAGRSAMSKRERYSKTQPEIKLEEFLKQNNVEYDYSCIMGSKERCFQYDFIIRHRRVLIEVQGDYWHGHPDMYNEDGTNGKKKLNEIQIKNMNRDKLKEQFALEKNFKLIYIWESEINKGDFSKIKEIL